MGLFNLFRKKQGLQNQQPALNDAPNNVSNPRVPKNIFIEESEPEFIKLKNSEKVGIELVYDYLQIDFERKGYEDALVNADESYMNDNVDLLIYDLSILVQKVDNFYTKQLKELEFHIESRKRMGLIDLVEELNSQREVLLYQMEKLNKIMSDIAIGNGVTKRLESSYQKGFLRGVSSLTKSRFMGN